MSVKVTLMVFSGRENPSWNLNDSQIEELKQRLGAIRQSTLQRPSGMLGGLGYTGFLIEAEREADIEPQIYVHDNICDLGPTNSCLQDSGNNIERWLLASASDSGAVPSSVNQYVAGLFGGGGNNAYAGRYGQRGAPHRMAKARPLQVPVFEPDVWNVDDNVRLHNNCYNYGNNKITNTFAQPGRGSGQVFTSLDPQEVARAAVRDGLEALADAEAWRSTPTDGHWIALVIWPPDPSDPSGTGDFHWYRLDDLNARWSHKPGGTRCRDVDESGQQISDPRTADRGPYSTFVGFFHSFPARITIS